MPFDDNTSLLRDTSSSGKDRPWKGKKNQAVNLYQSYSRLSDSLGEMTGNNVKPYFYKKRAALYNCGNVLGFASFEDSDTRKLGYAQFCRDRLCPMCSWRKSIRDFANLSKVIDCYFDRFQDSQALFLTLTVKNPEPEQLNVTLDFMHDSFRKMQKRRSFKRNVHGFFRALECNYKPPFSKYAPDTFHPHFHVMLVVRPSFFESDLWDSDDADATNDIWRNLWADSLGIDEEYREVLQVDIQRVSDREGVDWRSSVSEVAKYTVKDSDMFFGDPEITDRAVYYLSTCLRGRRLISYGGELRRIKSELKLIDADAGGDLVITDEDKLNDLVLRAMSFYGFNAGVYDYSLIDTIDFSGDGLTMSDPDYYELVQQKVLSHKLDTVAEYRYVGSEREKAEYYRESFDFDGLIKSLRNS